MNNGCHFKKFFDSRKQRNKKNRETRTEKQEEQKNKKNRKTRRIENKKIEDRIWRRVMK